MKKSFLTAFYLFLILCSGSVVNGQVTTHFTEILVPKYMYGNGFIGGSVIPYVFRAKLGGLQAGGAYSYDVSLIPDYQDVSDPNAGSANYLIKENGLYVLPYETMKGKFTADANGEYTDWFVVISSSYMSMEDTDIRLQINVSGAGNTNLETVFYSSSLVRCKNFGSADNGGTAIRSTAAAGAKAGNFVMLYDSDDVTARPVSGAIIENDGFDTRNPEYESFLLFAGFYKASVEGVDKAWAALVPNTNATGIRNIVQYNVDGSVAGNSSSADGKWAGLNGTVVNTVDPRGGEGDELIVLDGSVVTIAPPRQQPALAFAAPVPAEVFTGDKDFSVSVTSKSDGAITWLSGNTAVVTVDNAGMVHIAGPGVAEISAIQAENALYFADTVKATITVKVPRSEPVLSFPASFPTAVIIGSADFDAGVTSTSSAAIEYSSSNAAVITVDGNGVIHIAGVGSAVITASQQENADFKAGSVSKTLTVVDKQVPVVSFQPFSVKIYGDADLVPVASATSAVTPIYSTSNPAVAQVVDGKIKITGAGTADIKALFTATASYSEITATQTLTVQKKALTIIAEDKTRKQDVANPQLTVKYQGFVNGDTNTNALQEQPVVTTTAVTGSAPGVYPINVAGAVSANYSISYVPGNLTVELVMKDNVISFPNISVKDYGQAEFELLATATSGLPVTLASSNTDVAVIVGSKIRITGAGTATITAIQPGNISYVAAEPVVQTLTVRKAFLVIAPVDTFKVQGATNPVFRARYTGFVNGDNASVLTTQPAIRTSALTVSPAGIYELVAGGAAAANYDIVYNKGVFTINSANGGGQDELLSYCDAPGQLKITVNVQAAAKVSIQLFDAAGKKVLDMPVNLSKGFNTYHINVSRLMPGVYPLRVAGGSLILKSKAVVR